MGEEEKIAVFHPDLEKSIDDALKAMRFAFEDDAGDGFEFEQQRTNVFVYLTRGLAGSINKASEASGRLGKRVLFLNWVLVALTAVIAAAAWFAN